MSNPSYYLDGAAVSARAAQVPNASFANGANAAASCAAGIGIGQGVPNVAGTPAQFTLLDQAGAERAPQDSQHIGLAASPIDIGTNNAAGNGTMTTTGEATLGTLAQGWVSILPV